MQKCIAPPSPVLLLQKCLEIQQKKKGVFLTVEEYLIYHNILHHSSKTKVFSLNITNKTLLLTTVRMPKPTQQKAVYEPLSRITLVTILGPSWAHVSRKL